MRQLRAIGLWGGILLSLIWPQNTVFSEEVPQDHLDHFSEKYPDAPEFDPVPALKIRGFGDFTFKAGYQDPQYDSEFRFGGMSLLITSELNRRLSFLAELSSYRDVYYLESTNPGFLNSSVFEFQRFVLKYILSDHVNIGVGRYHTALGYWNHTYHHGTWLQPSISRPEIYRFEFEGGILPEHSVGVEAFGFKALNGVDLRYHLGVSNGRGQKLWVVQNFRDANRSKALSVFLTFLPHRAEGLKFGGAFYLDTLPKDPSDPGQANPTDERIYGGHLIYNQERFEFLAEFFQIQHAEENTGSNFDTEGAYVQGNLKTLAFVAYYRYDFIDFAEGSPVFWDFHQDVKKHALGLRWDLLSWSALKLEFSRSKHKNLEPDYGLLVNSSFTF